MNVEHEIHQLEPVVEKAAAYIASSSNRRIARLLIHNALERQIREIDIEAHKFVAEAEAVALQSAAPSRLVTRTSIAGPIGVCSRFLPPTAQPIPTSS